MLCTCLCTNCKAHNKYWDMWLTKYISTNLRSSKYEIRIIKFHIYLHMCCHWFVVHHLETLHDILLHLFFLNWGKYFFGECHTINHKNHNKILEYSSQLPSEYEHHACILLTWDTSTSFIGSLGASESSYSLSPSGCDNYNLGPPSWRLHANLCIKLFLTHECE